MINHKKTQVVKSFVVRGLFFFILSVFILFFHTKTRAQFNYQVYSNASLAEKIYLQLDANVYTTCNIIWFKCIVANACTHVPSALSKILYVELIRPDKTIHERKIIKLNNGIGEGFFSLDKDLMQGIYLLRAYTHWNKNFGTDFIFNEYIQVFEPGMKEKNPITNVTLIKNQEDEKYLEARLNPLDIDSLHKNDLIVTITIDKKIETLKIKRGKNNQYQISYPITNTCQFVTLKMQTANQKQFTKNIILNDNYIDLQFFPESGELVHGLQSKIGFKSIDANGKGKIVYGDILDDRDSVIAHFKSNALGMGTFVLEIPDSAKTYYARITTLTAESLFAYFPLPTVAGIGNQVSVSKQEEYLSVIMKSNYLGNDSVHVRFSYRGMGFYENKVGLHYGELEFLLSCKDLPEGIISFTMYDKHKQPIAERLFFNERPANRIETEISADKKKYSKRELTNLIIKTTDNEGKPIKANLSLLVINKEQLGELQNLRQNILSWFLLDSELKGEIENPGFYFHDNSNRFDDLDALMLTQGWRKYNYSKPFNDLPFKPESSLSVSGSVSSVFSSKKRKIAELTMITFGKTINLYKIKTDSLGYFEFKLDDEYGSDLNLVIQSTKKKNKNMNYTISLNGIESPRIDVNSAKHIAKLDSIVQFLIEKNDERQRIDEEFPLDSGNILIKEVEVKAYRLTPNRKLVMEGFGEPDVVIDGKEILEKEEKWSYGLYNVLMFNYPDQIEIRGRGHSIWANVKGSQYTLVVIDGIPVKIWQYNQIPYIPPSIVSSVEIFKCANNFLRLLMEVSESPDPAIDCGSIIAIYTHAGKGINYAIEPTGLLKTSVPVFSEPREFYAPKYNIEQADEWKKPDLRALIYWKPIFTTDSNGIAQASFYNADISGKMMVIVEAISDDGNIGYREIDYEIVGNEFFIIE